MKLRLHEKRQLFFIIVSVDEWQVIKKFEDIILPLPIRSLALLNKYNFDISSNRLFSPISNEQFSFNIIPKDNLSSVNLPI
ncbi:MAG TPA: hypothetical protein VJZ69_03025, partial [Clostridia bacterium]|nr:hypothetical protein [Clostridia bacterium]